MRLIVKSYSYILTLILHSYTLTFSLENLTFSTKLGLMYFSHSQGSIKLVPINRSFGNIRS